MNFVGINSTQLSSYLNWYNENATGTVYPQDLYQSMQFSRLGYVPTAQLAPRVPTYVSPGYGCDGTTICCLGTGNATCPACPASANSEWRGLQGMFRLVAAVLLLWACFVSGVSGLT